MTWRPDVPYICTNCETIYAEYVNGCPRCWRRGIRAGTVPAPTGEPSEGAAS